VHIDARLLLALLSVACVSPGEAAPSAAPEKGSETSSTCAHVVEVMSQTKTVQDSNALAQVLDDCEASLAELEHGHEKLSACMLAARSKAEITTCERTVPRYQSVLRSLDPTPAEVCDHVMDVMKRELGEDGSTPSEEDVEKFLSECAREIGRERQKIGDERFRQQARCIMEAQSMDVLAKCEPKESAP